MGSGHFLVGALDYLANKLLEAYEKDFEKYGLNHETQPTKEWARRLVLSHCIYGVDLNPLAVELAKVSLWLSTLSTDKPLSFLDHRLKKGNSLIGMAITDLLRYHEGEKKDNMNLRNELKISPAVTRKILTKINEIEGISEDTLDDIKKKENFFKELQDIPEYQKLLKIADLHTSFYFGNKISGTAYKKPSAFYIDLIGSLYGNEREWERKTNYNWFNKGVEIGKENMFFHWELEFPEIFFGASALKENPGWDVVIGNPPWEKISAKSKEKHYLDIKYMSIREGEINFYNLFLMQCYFLVKKNGVVGQLVPNTWLINKFSRLLRNFVLKNYLIKNLHYLCKGVFKDAPDTIPVIIHFIKKEYNFNKNNENSVQVNVVDDNYLGKPEFLSKSVWNDCANQSLWFARPLHQMSVYDTKRNYSFTKLIEKDSILLGDLGHASDGIYKSTVQKFITPVASCPTDYPVIESADQINRYTINWGGAFIPQDLWFKHLELHNGDKIILHAARKPKLKRRLVAAYTEKLVFFSNRFIIVKIDDNNYSAKYILSILNSKLLNRYYKIRFPITDIDGYMLHQLPIKKINFSTSQDVRLNLFNEAVGLYIKFKDDLDSTLILAFVKTRLTILNESDVVHDLLRYLVDEIIEMNDQKNKEIMGFLSWLEQEIGSVSIFNFNNKTALKKYYEESSNDIIAILRKNKNKIPVDLSKRTFKENIERELNASKQILVPILSLIQATDQLIDNIVYQLYEVPEEEIKLIEYELN